MIPLKRGLFMSLKDKWKQTGKDVGGAFANLGKALGTTAKVVFTDEENSNGEGKKTKTGEAWTNVGHGFANFGNSFADAVEGTVDKATENIDNKEEDKK